MFSNFKDAFITKPQYSSTVPQAVLDVLGQDLPNGFSYINGNNGMCLLYNDDGMNFSGNKFNIPQDDKHLFKDDMNINKILLYCYNTQKPLEMLPDSDGNYIINNKKIHKSKLVKTPMKNFDFMDGQLFLQPSAFPKPRELKLACDNYKINIMVKRVAHHSITECKYESVNSVNSPFKITFTVDIRTRKMDMTVNVNRKATSSVEKLVNAYHIADGLFSGNCYINKIDIFDGEKPKINNVNNTINQETIKFWDKVLDLENKLDVSFNASYEMPIEDCNCILELYQCIINKKPFKSREVINSVNGDIIDSERHLYKDMIGKDLCFEFVMKEKVEILGVEISYCSLIAVFDTVVKNIKMQEEEKHFVIELDNQKDKQRYSSKMHFISLEELEEYKNTHPYRELLEKADSIAQFI